MRQFILAVASIKKHFKTLLRHYSSSYFLCVNNVYQRILQYDEGYLTTDVLTHRVRRSSPGRDLPSAKTLFPVQSSAVLSVLLNNTPPPLKNKQINKLRKQLVIHIHMLRVGTKPHVTCLVLLESKQILNNTIACSSDSLA